MGWEFATLSATWNIHIYIKNKDNTWYGVSPAMPLSCAYWIWLIESKNNPLLPLSSVQTGEKEGERER